MILRINLILTASIIRLVCIAQNDLNIYKSEGITIQQLSQNTYRHISYLHTEQFGKVSCNGLVVVDKGEALIFDTPSTDTDSKELINWVSDSLKCKIVGVVATHFHEDCLGGINEFHSRQIPSFASFKTIELAKQEDVTAPQNGFKTSLKLRVGDQYVINQFLGEGHTIDNIVSYFPKEKVLFGGCLIKSLGASKGYLGDANTQEWSNTVSNVKTRFKKANVIVPGHGNPGNTELLDYTIQLFKP